MADRIQLVIDYVSGSCKSLSEACRAYDFEEEDLTSEELQHLDNEIFYCTNCGWWHERHEEGDSPAGESWCQTCCEENEDEE